MTSDSWIGRLASSPAEFGASDTRLRHRLRLLAGCAFLAAVAFSMAPGRIIAETKLDMTVNPLGFLGRALHMWEPTFFGQLQNQAYGYLFPMGPFYAAGAQLGMPPWAIQRLWVALVLCVAFTGVVQLVRAMRLGGSLAGVVAGLAYALAPHAQALMGFNSAEFSPSAVLPWIMLPLVRGSDGTLSPRRAACLSALAFVGAGGINASAELAVLVVPGVYLLTRRWGPRQRRLVGWWLPAIAAVSLWWLVPLVLLGRYVFSFMPYTENARTTTLVSSLTNVLRGVNDWVAFLPVDGRPYLPAGYEHTSAAWLVVGTALLAGLGLAGLTLRRTPERAFLVGTLLVGVTILVAGHAGPLAEPIRDLLDGVLSPFRNLHKFNAVVRLPLVLGLAAFVSFVGLKRPAVRLPAAFGGACLVGLSLVPVASAGIAPSGSFSELPGYWRDAAAWLDDRAELGAVLAVPGARRGEYVWGRPLDEPLQPLLKKARWVSNTNVPWGSAGGSRLIDAIDDRFAGGYGSAGLTATLRRIGVRYLVVRNDLDRVALAGAWPARVHETLDRSPGLTRVRGFGPRVGFEETTTAAGWFDQPYSALEIYEVSGARPIAGTVTGEPLRVSGGPEALLTMAEEGVLTDDRPVFLGADPGDADEVVLTDTMRRRDLSVSDLRRAATATLARDDAFQSVGPVEDLTDPAWAEPKTVAWLSEVAGVRASSSESGLDALPNLRDPGRQPYAAVDGDVRTGWRSTGWEPPTEEWLEIEFTGPIEVSPLKAVFEDSDDTADVTEVTVETDAGTARTRLTPAGGWQTLNVRRGTTSRVRIEISRTAGPDGRAGILEVSIPGVRAERTLVVPDLPGAGDRTIVTGRTDAVPSCMRGSYAWTCAPELGVLGDDGYGFDRSFPVRTGGDRVLTGRTTLTDQRLATRMLTFPGVYPKVTASSTKSDVPATGPWAAFDDDRRTIWYAADQDISPSLTAELGRTVRLSRIRVDFPDLRLGAPPVRVTIETDGGTRHAWASADGWIRFAPLRASSVKLTFSAAGRRPVEILGVAVPGVDPLPSYDAVPVTVPCGLGPQLFVDGKRVLTEIVAGTMRDVLHGTPLTYRTCEPVAIGEGQARVRAPSVQGFRVDSLVVRAADAATAPATTMTPARVETWGPGERRIAVSTTEPSYLVVNENFNVGWEAKAGGRTLEPVRLDGWRQAWRLPPTDGAVTIVYGPDRLYQVSLAVGWVLVALVLVAAVIRRRPRPDLPAAGPARIRAARWWPFAPLLGFWVDGLAAAVVVGVVGALAIWWRHVALAEHGTGRWFLAARLFTSPWPVIAGLGVAGVALAAGAEQVAQLASLAVLGLLFAAIGTPVRPDAPPGDPGAAAGARPAVLVETS
ncbi:alpha-(1-_3)-arabinofuranosyltransferase domain-containing protein [Streptosporangium soli]|nr:alpha-(1->3)-arabinofuranosyltransferase [Streptosporangium sp. KLBMP 9127]